jgi:hypothetical protein
LQLRSIFQDIVCLAAQDPSRSRDKVWCRACSRACSALSIMPS